MPSTGFALCSAVVVYWYYKPERVNPAKKRKKKRKCFGKQLPGVRKGIINAVNVTIGSFIVSVIIRKRF